MTSADESAVARKLARHNTVAGFALMAFAGFFFWKSFGISLDFVDEEGIGPRFFPQAVCVALAAVGLLITVLGLRGNAAPADKSTFNGRRFLTDAVPLFVLSLLFVWMFGAFGYVTACFVLLLASMVVFAVRGPALILMPVGATVVLYLVFFHLMTVFQPEATIFNPLSLIGLN